MKLELMNPEGKEGDNKKEAVAGECQLVPWSEVVAPVQPHGCMGLNSHVCLHLIS